MLEPAAVSLGLAARRRTRDSRDEAVTRRRALSGIRTRYAISLACLGVLGGSPASADPYVAGAIDYPGASQTWATGINNDGFIVGLYNKGNAESGAFVRSPDGAYYRIGGEGWVALGINNLGQIVGDAGTMFLRDPGGSVLHFDYPNATGRQANGLNDGEAIVGAYYVNSQDSGAFIRFVDGSFGNFRYLGASDTNAYGINNVGQIVGQINNGSLSYVRGSDGTFSAISFPEATQTQAFGINNSGQISGTYYNPEVGTHGFVRDADGSFRQVDISSSSSPKVHTIVWGINDSGLVAGYFVAEGGDRTRGLIGYPLPEPRKHVGLMAGTLGLVVLASARRRQKR